MNTTEDKRDNKSLNNHNNNNTNNNLINVTNATINKNQTSLTADKHIKKNGRILDKKLEKIYKDKGFDELTKQMNEVNS